MTLVWGLIVLIIVVVGALWLLGGTGEKTYDKDGNEIVNARAGEFISGFPSDLIREEGVLPEESYVINYTNEGRRLLQARYISSLSFQQNVDLFKRTLDEFGWTFTRYPGNEAPVTNIGAVKDGAEVNVTVVFKTNGETSVEIAYLSASTNPDVVGDEPVVEEDATTTEDPSEEPPMEEAPSEL